MNKIKLGEVLEELVETEAYQALNQLITRDVKIYIKKVLKVLPRGEYEETVGRIKGLRSIQFMINKAIRDKKTITSKTQKDE